MTKQPRRIATPLAMTLLLLSLSMIPGCATVAGQTSQPAPSNTTVSASGDQAVAVNRDLSHGYTALYNMAEKNKQLDKLLWIKSVTPETKALVDRISKASRQTADAIEAIAKASPAIELDDDGVAKIDGMARDGIESNTRKTLLMTGGEDFEVQLILAQIRAMQWGAEMADALAEADDAHAQQMQALAEQMANIRDALTERLALAK